MSNIPCVKNKNTRANTYYNLKICFQISMNFKIFVGQKDERFELRKNNMKRKR